ncbi:MAG: hypothetical protein HN394_03805, partial [Rhodospirillaceae bacterium]|nr:hypothetical protein [Rhodospirillaceae bacterium]
MPEKFTTTGLSRRAVILGGASTVMAGLSGCVTSPIVGNAYEVAKAQILGSP